MTTISRDNPCITLVNVFTVAPERQQELLDLLEEATTSVMRYQPGYRSANLHRGLDGTHIVNYAQWRSRADFEAMLRDPIAQQHMQAALAIAQAAPVLYEVAFTDEVAA